MSSLSTKKKRYIERNQYDFSPLYLLQKVHSPFMFFFLTDQTIKKIVRRKINNIRPLYTYKIPLSFYYFYIIIRRSCCWCSFTCFFFVMFSPIHRFLYVLFYCFKFYTISVTIYIFWKTTILAIDLSSVQIHFRSMQNTKVPILFKIQSLLTFYILTVYYCISNTNDRLLFEFLFFFLFFHFWNIKYVFCFFCPVFFLFHFFQVLFSLISSQQVPCSNDSNINVFIWKYSLHFNTLTF